MYVLGIETSCDETSAAVVKDGRKVLSCETSSSLKFHKRYGGVVPEIAFRLQLQTIAQVTDTAIKEAGVNLKDIGLVSVTSGPGLLGSLLVGISFAKAVSVSLGIPLLGVDHLHSHIYANFLMVQESMEHFPVPLRKSPKVIAEGDFLDGAKIKLPFVALVVSGGHTNLFYIKDFDRIEIIGQTQDDACGEAFDKVAKILGLGYPGGPQVERMANAGNGKKIKFCCCGTKGQLDFSFSGIKTAVLYLVRDRRLTIAEKKDIAASFQETVIDALIRKSLLACKLKKVKSLVIGGGVVANNRLRKKIYEAAKENSVGCYFPPRDFCIDNAAMVAGFGYQLFQKGVSSNLDLAIPSN